MDDLIAEWVRLARRDMRAARRDVEDGDAENGLYMCQQAAEKALKAHVHADTGDLPPKVHNLRRLADLAGVWDSLSGPTQLLLDRLTIEAAGARYGAFGVPNSGLHEDEEAVAIVTQVEEVVECLLSGLK